MRLYGLLGIKYVFVCKACGKLGGPGTGNFVFWPFIRHNLVKSGTFLHKHNSPFIVSLAFECKFEPFERDLKHSNPSSNHSKRIRSIWIKFEPFETDSNHSKGIWSIRIQNRTPRKEFEAFECKFEPFKRDSKHLNANSNHSKGLEAFECKF